MICSKIISRTLLSSKNFVPPVTRLHRNVFSFSNFKPPLTTDIDVGNLAGFLQANETPFLSFWEKVSEFGWTSIYTGLDNFSRELLFTVANEWGVGLPLGIVCVSLALRLLFFYPGLVAQINGLKMKELKPFMTRYQQKMQAAQMSRNRALMKQAQKQFGQVRKEKGIDTFIPMINLLQIPLLITWFLSLRYITNLPEVFPQVQTSNFLWIKDLAAYDPYFILPVISACLMSLSITYSPTMNKQNVTMSFMIPLIKYLKQYFYLMKYRFMPFLSLPITAMFPAAINLYWLTVSCVQCLTVAMLHTKAVKVHFGIINKVQKPKVIQAAFVEEKRTQKGASTGQSTTTQETPSKKPVLNTSGPTQSIKITTSRPKKSKQ